jgi:CheY-like chemotaxis protein
MASVMRIVAVMADLMFSVKIIDMAKRLGLTVEFVKEEETFLRTLREGAPAVVIFDLNYAPSDPLSLIRQMKADPQWRLIPTVGFVSHVQTELRREAAEAGCDQVVARSAFAQRLPEILAPYATAARS